MKCDIDGCDGLVFELSSTGAVLCTRHKYGVTETEPPAAPAMEPPPPGALPLRRKRARPAEDKAARPMVEDK